MQSEQRIKDTTASIISFANSYTCGKKGKLNEQSKPEPESTTPLKDIISSLEFLLNQIQKNITHIQVIYTQKLLHSLSILTIYKINGQGDQKFDKQTFEVRRSSRYCLWNIHLWSDEYVQSELVRIRYANILAIAISTAGGSGEEQDLEIMNGLSHIYQFLAILHNGSNYPLFLPLPLLAHSSKEQIEEEGGNEEVEAQLINNGNINCNIKDNAKWTKRSIFDHFIHSS
ncbi:MAG: hypothetical protein EZS28_013734 [Streblomastix strix]|uniref:Uncharacterized protein n=1 Tax=Streblomastix strix TaxID=222440 RepID=A0A5J4W834_9EUKA|nr:MAG: hypothetical protein EZS28_013734 [Streblomastix strix]